MPRGISTSAAFPKVTKIALTPSERVPKAGSSTVRITTAKSSTRVIPIMTRPC
jgi:hypothetical protein